MKVYAVMDGLEDCDGPVALYATQELAAAALGARVERLRLAWMADVTRAGQPIPRQGVKVGGGRIEPQRYQHPGTFNDWLQRRGERWIEEWDVVDASDSSDRVSDKGSDEASGDTKKPDPSVDRAEGG